MADTLDDEYEALCETYRKNLPDKIKELQTSFHNLSSNWDLHNFLEFSSLTHKLSGSAGIYGYDSISQKMAEVEASLSRYNYDIPAEKQTLQDIEKKLTEVENLISNAKVEISKSAIPQVQTNQVFVLKNPNNYSLEVEWAQKLIEQASLYGYEVKTFNDIKLLLETLTHEQPLALLIDFDLLADNSKINLNDPTIRNMIKLHFKKTYTLFFAKSGEFEKRLNAVRLGCKNYLLTPLNVSDLINELDNLKQLWHSKFKAIILDDSPDILSYYSNLLTNANIENKALSSFQEMEKELHTFEPDVILLDLNMPECSGIEAAAIIRQQKIYEDVPIIFLSTEENKNIQLQAMSVGADDFVTKSADALHLISTIRNKASRYKKIKSLLIKNNLTGAFSYKFMCKQIEKNIDIFKKTHKNFSICITQIDNLNTVKENYGYAVLDQLIAKLYMFLETNLDSSRIIGTFSSYQFLILFPDTDSQKAKAEMEKIQKEYQATLQYTDVNAYVSSFSIGIATYNKGETIDEFIKTAADKVL